jgi:hypothetical protein
MLRLGGKGGGRGAGRGAKGGSQLGAMGGTWPVAGAGASCWAQWVRRWVDGSKLAIRPPWICKQVR